MSHNFHIPFSEYLAPCIKYKKRRSEKRACIIKRRYPLSQAKILEIGCGPGFLIQQLSDIMPGNEYLAMDVQREALEFIMKERKRRPTIQCVQNESYRFPLKDNLFDLVLCEECIHGIDFQRFLNEVLRIVKPGGKAFFIDLNPNSPFLHMIKWIRLIIGFFSNSSLSSFHKAFNYSVTHGYKKEDLQSILNLFNKSRYQFNKSLNWYSFEVSKLL